jgi:hypothetical protein
VFVLTHALYASLVDFEACSILWGLLSVYAHARACVYYEALVRPVLVVLRKLVVKCVPIVRRNW